MSIAVSEYPVIQQRCTFYPEHIVKRDRFRQIYRKFKEDKSKNLNEARTNVISTLRSEGNLKHSEQFLEDLRTLTYLTSNEEDLNTVLKCLQRFPDLTPESIATIYIRKLVSLEKLDMATNVLLNKNNTFDFMQNQSSYIALVDSLMDNKKYSDVVSIFETKFLPAKIVPRLIFVATTLSLLKINDKTSMEKVKRYVDHMRNKGLHLTIGSVVHVFFLALQQNEITYGFKFLSQSNRIHKSLYCNLLIIGLSSIDQVGAAISYAEKLLQIEITTVKSTRKSDSTEGKFFRLTLNYLEEAVERSKEKNLLERFGLVIDKLKTDRILENNMLDYFSNPGLAASEKDFKLNK